MTTTESLIARQISTAKITQRGAAFCGEFAPYVTTTVEMEKACSLIARLARTHARLIERECSEPMTEAGTLRWAADVERIEKRITALVESFPTYNGQRMTAVFTGDPRGFTVRVKVPGRNDIGNTWGRDGEFGI